MALGAVILFVIAVSTVAHLASVARIALSAAAEEGELLARQLYHQSSQVVGAAWQGGLGLPEREYYLKQDDKSKQLRDAYVKHVAKMFELLGDATDAAATEATTVLGIETSLANASMKNTDLRDPNKTYHRMSMADLQAMAPDFNWESYFKALGRPELKEINVGQPDFFKVLVTSRSRVWLREILLRQNSALPLGCVPCLGQPCQKQPSTKIASLSLGKTKSGLTLTIFNFAFLIFNCSCLRHPVILCRRNNFASATSVALFPRERMRDITSERFTLENTSNIFS